MITKKESLNEQQKLRLEFQRLKRLQRLNSPFLKLHLTKFLIYPKIQLQLNI
jgi:hypothetical protein